MTRRLRPVGDRALLVECPGEDPAGVALALRAAGLDGVVDVVPAATTVLITVDRADRVAAVSGPAAGVVPAATTATASTVVLEVTYGGPDLEVVADLSGMAVDEVIARHLAGAYRVAFCGFAPGYAYLEGLDAALHVPRRAEPRTRVPAGSVAVAGRYSAVYPRATPGGWMLIGTCRDRLWDATADPPTRLVPGTPVRFTRR